MRATKLKSNSPLTTPQMGFGFEVMDAKGNRPGFLYERDEVYAALDVIQQALWASVDVETTGLTDASSPVTLDSVLWKQGASAEVRMRTIQVRVPTLRGRSGSRKDFAFDCDRMGPELTQVVANTILSRRMFIAHNAGFDLYWLRRAEGRATMPALVVDTMLLTRLLRPALVLKRAEILADIKHVDDVPASDSNPQRMAWNSLIGGKSGGSLADVVLSMFGVVVDKTFQKPTNWTGLLGFGHYDYAIDDVVWADRILCDLMGVGADGDVFHAYLGQRARKSTVRLIEPQVPELVLLREHGMPINTYVGQHYVVVTREELADQVNAITQLEPALEAFRGVLSDPDAGLDDELKKAVAAAFESRGVLLRRTAATGAPQVGEKDLRACKAVNIKESRPLFNAWVAVNRSKKASSMAWEVCGFAARSEGGRLRSLMSHGPVTGRLSSSECNVQQFPRDQLFRAMCMSHTRPGCETMDVAVTEANQPLLAKAVRSSSVDRNVMALQVQVGTVVTVNSGWLAGLFAADKIQVLATEQNQALLERCTGQAVIVGKKVSTSFSGYAEVMGASDERQALSDQIDEQFTHRVVASDFGALDVRVGAALCIRSQREMMNLALGHVVPGPVQPPENVVDVILAVVRTRDGANPAAALAKQAEQYKQEVGRHEKSLEALSEDLDAKRIQRGRYFTLRGIVKKDLLAAKLGWRLAQCLSMGVLRGEREYSALRDAFVAEIDIHTFTGAKLAKRDILAEFAGLSVAERKTLEKKLKKELGPRRQQGKIANLSLLYGMADAGFQEAAARGYNEHWTLQESGEIRALWMDAYPEVELWHLWTECLQAGVVYVPEKGKEKPVRSGWWMARTLAGRDIVAMGLNAALSYQDQSTGADILGLIMHRLHVEYPHIFDTAINQVHDEIVFCWPAEHQAVYLPIVEQVMVEEANSLTMTYGVPTNVSPACGVLWIKD